MSSLNLQILLTGNELMSGDVIDTNSAHIAQQVKELGIHVNRRVTIGDSIKALIAEIEDMSKLSDVLIVNGGLGPTTDDLTSQALSKVANQPLIENQQAMQHLHEWSKKRSFTLDKANLTQAWLPESANIIPNRTGSAVGIHLNINDCDIYCTPGVPSELKIMLHEEVIPLLEQKVPKQEHSHTTRLQTFGIGESRLQTMIEEAFPDWPSQIELGYRANSPTLELKLTTYTNTDHMLKTEWLTKIHNLLNDHVIGEITDKPLTLPEAVINLLSEKKLTLTTAESCTGGLIASQITSVAGSSQVFEAGFVTYSNSIKENVLSVPSSIITSYGAVSQQTVLAMAHGALTKSHADIAVAVSGIAGPSGGTPEKPVGTVWIAWGTSKNMLSQRFLIHGNREYFQKIVAARSLDLVRRLLIESKHSAIYAQNYN
jgi:nicotinamide-nucleotide amidase